MVRPVDRRIDARTDLLQHERKRGARWTLGRGKAAKREERRNGADRSVHDEKPEREDHSARLERIANVRNGPEGTFANRVGIAPSHACSRAMLV